VLAVFKGDRYHNCHHDWLNIFGDHKFLSSISFPPKTNQAMDLIYQIYSFFISNKKAISAQ